MFDHREAHDRNYQYGRQTFDGRVGSQGMSSARPKWLIAFEAPATRISGAFEIAEARDVNQAHDYAEAFLNRWPGGRAGVQITRVARIEYERQW